MKKAQGTTRAKIARHILTYFICLLLAVLTWTLVMYAEYEDKFLPGQNYSVVESHTKDTVTSSGSVD